jgi:hypothetical protein
MNILELLVLVNYLHAMLEAAGRRLVADPSHVAIHSCGAMVVVLGASGQVGSIGQSLLGLRVSGG